MTSKVHKVASRSIITTRYFVLYIMFYSHKKNCRRRSKNLPRHAACNRQFSDPSELLFGPDFAVEMFSQRHHFSSPASTSLLSHNQKFPDDLNLANIANSSFEKVRRIVSCSKMMRD